MMNDKKRLELIERISSGIATDEELSSYNDWCNALQAEAQAVPDFGAIKTSMLSNINDKIDHKGSIRLINYKMISVAAALAAVVFGFWFYTSRTFTAAHQEIVYQNDVAPGKNTATLTLANGKTIALSDSKTGFVYADENLKYNDGTAVEVEKMQSQMLTATTPRAGMYQISLPDGTRVWMNADSKISFPSKFSNTERKVSLQGEAYFEVAKRYRPTTVKGDSSVAERLPFIVVTDRQEITVLGTHFNINSYTDEVATKTTLLEGSVRVAVLGAKNTVPQVILKPGEQAVSKDNIKVEKVDMEEVVAWKNGSFRFKDRTLESVMRELSRWYDVDIVYAADAPKYETFSGAVSRTRNISTVLERIQTTGSVGFKIEGRTITVTK